MTGRKPLRFPRTLAEAWPQSPEYGCAIERPAQRPYPRVLWVALVLGLFAALVAARS